MGAQAVRLSNVDIDNALKNRDFEVLFQPIFDLSNGAFARVETFVRWRHAGLGVLPPGAFISFFESQGRMSELSRYVLNEALTKYLQWRGPYAPGFSINLALSDLGDEAFVSHFNVLLREHGFPAELVTLECPMPPVDQDLEVATRHFERLAGTGARLAIEVRGRTNDFLRKIDPFPFDEIKTGGAAILRFARTVRGPGLSAISELLELATEQKAAITAVGVEDQSSLCALRSLGFSAAQGNHLGKVGQLASFRPSRVNEVRGLLELAPLDKEDLAAMFRTSAPAVMKAGQKVPTKAAAKTPQQGSGTNAKKIAEFPTSETGDLDEIEDDLLDRLAARIAENENPDTVEKSLRMSRPDDRSLKAAAIEKAKNNAPNTQVFSEEENPARDLQSRLSDEFSGDEPVAEEPEKPQKPKPKSRKTPGKKKTISSSTKKQSVAAKKGAKIEDKKEPTTDKDEPPESPGVEIALDNDKAATVEKAPTTEKSDDKEQFSGASDELAASANQSAVKAVDAIDAQNKADDQHDQLNEDRSISMQKVNTDPHGQETKSMVTKLTVGPVKAQFVPIVHVGPSQPDEREPVIPEVDVADPASITVEQFQTPQSSATDIERGISPDDVEDSPEDMAIDAEQSWTEESARIYATVQRTKPKNFLTRKYRVVPTHFWPKSWKKAWRRHAEHKSRTNS